MNSKLEPFIENISEATTACLIAMVQGNLLAISLSHWLIASQTGLTAGTITATLVILFKTQKRWIISLGLGLITCFADYLVHPGMFGSIFAEAIVTGIGASFLSYMVGTAIKAMRVRKKRGVEPSPKPGN